MAGDVVLLAASAPFPVFACVLDGSVDARLVEVIALYRALVDELWGQPPEMVLFAYRIGGHVGVFPFVTSPLEPETRAGIRAAVLAALDGPAPEEEIFFGLRPPHEQWKGLPGRRYPGRALLAAHFGAAQN